MNGHDSDRTEAIQQIATILAAAYLRLRFPYPAPQRLDSPEKRAHMGLLVNTMRTETNRTTSVREEIEALGHMTVGQLKDRYRDVFGEPSRSNHKQFLVRRIAWRIQANAWGGLQNGHDADLRIRAPKNFLKTDLDEARTIETRVAPTDDPRLPMPGTELVRRYRGKDIVVRVRQDGFEYAGKIYRSLSSAVREATGTPWNGFAFFGLASKPGRKHGSH